GRRRQRQIAMAVLPRTPGVVDPPRITGEITAAVPCHQLQIGKARQRSRKDQVVKRKRGVERITEHVVEIKMSQALAMRESIRMHHDEGPKLLGPGKEGTEFRI